MPVADDRLPWHDRNKKKQKQKAVKLEETENRNPEQETAWKIRRPRDEMGLPPVRKRRDSMMDRKIKANRPSQA
jgi:hypothetical protein